MNLHVQDVLLPSSTRVALIDMDGTATRCTDAINFRATEAVFRRRGLLISESTHAIGRGQSREHGFKLMLEALERPDLRSEIPSMAEEKNREANRLREQLTPSDVPREDRAVLERLSACGIQLALGSSSRNALDTLNRVRLTRLFDVIVTGNEVAGATGKTDVWRLALSYFGAEGREAIVIEDAQSGIDDAETLGVTFSVGIGAKPLKATVQATSLGTLIVSASSC